MRRSPRQWIPPRRDQYDPRLKAILTPVKRAMSGAGHVAETNLE